MKSWEHLVKFVELVKICLVPAIFIIFCHTHLPAQGKINVLSPISDIPQSMEYKVAISTFNNKIFTTAHVHYTEARPKNAEWGSNFYVADYKFSYVNFEFEDTEVYINVALPNKDVPDFEIRPTKKNITVSYSIGDEGYREAILRFPKPTTPYLKSSYISVVPIENGLANTKNALGLFANPFINLPSEGIVTVQSGESIPKDSDLKKGQTLVFSKGLHDIGIEYKLKSGVKYFLDNGAYVKGTFEERTLNDELLEDVKIYGYGILSTNHIKRFLPDGKTKFQHSPIDLLNSSNVSIVGITIEDPSHHALNIGGLDKYKGVYISKVKILGWRANGDGIHIIGSGLVEDCFLRTQDDSVYIASGMDGVEFRRITTWNDFNGSSFIFTANGGGGNVHVSNSDVIYVRSRFNSKIESKWETYIGGGVFNLRGLGENEIIENIILEDIRIEDDLPESPVFLLQQNPSLRMPNSKNFEFTNIIFKNIDIKSDFLYKNRFIGKGSNPPENIIFNCVKSNGKLMADFKNWTLEGNIDLQKIHFENCIGD